MGEILKDFCMIVVEREKSRLVPLNLTPTGRTKPFANASIETPPVITLDRIKPISVMLVILLKRLIFFDSLYADQCYQLNMPQFQLVF